MFGFYLPPLRFSKPGGHIHQKNTWICWGFLKISDPPPPASQNTPLEIFRSLHCNLCSKIWKLQNYHTNVPFTINSWWNCFNNNKIIYVYTYIRNHVFVFGIYTVLGNSAAIFLCHVQVLQNSVWALPRNQTFNHSFQGSKVKNECFRWSEYLLFSIFWLYPLVDANNFPVVKDFKFFLKNLEARHINVRPSKTGIL